MKKDKIFAFFAALALAVTPLAGCAPDENIAGDDYPSYRDDLPLFPDEGEDDGNSDAPQESDPGDGDATGGEGGEKEYVPVPAEQYEGLTQLSDVKYDFATPFFGKYAFVMLDGKAFLLDRDGKRTEFAKNVENDNTMSDIIGSEVVYDDVQLLYDKMYVHRGGLCGVTDLYGEVIVPLEYDNIDMVGETLLCRTGTEFHVYIGREKVRSFTARKAFVCTEELLSVDDKIVLAASGEVASVSGYELVSAPIDGVATIVDRNFAYGFASYPSGDVFIEPKYFICGDFSCGVACVNEALDGKDIDYEQGIFFGYPKLIDGKGETLFDFSALSDRARADEMDVKLHYNGYSVCHIVTDNSYFAVDLNSVPAAIVPLAYEPRNGRIYDGFYIVEGTNRVVSLGTGEFIERDRVSITEAGSCFITENLDGKYSLLGADLSPLIDGCEAIEAYENTVMIKSGGMYSFYFLP